MLKECVICHSQKLLYACEGGRTQITCMDCGRKYSERQVAPFLQTNFENQYKKRVPNRIIRIGE